MVNIDEVRGLKSFLLVFDNERYILDSVELICDALMV
jgi:hypothetical protein